MALPVWPAALGDLRPDYSGGLSVLPIKRRLVTQMDDGPPRVRRASYVDTTELKAFKINLDLTKLQIFTTFTRDTLNGATSRFTAPLVTLTGGVATKTCRIDGEDGPTITYLGGLMAQATFDLLVWNWR